MSSLVNYSNINEFISLISNFPEPNYTEEELLKILQELFPVFMNSLKSWLGDNSTKAINECQNRVDSLIDARDTDLLFDIIAFSGKGVSDFGSEKDCIQSGLAYFKLVYSLDINPERNIEHEEDRSVITFLGQSNFITGICFIKECIELMEIVTQTKNEKINNFFNELNFHNRTMITIKRDSLVRSNGLAIEIIMWIVIAYFLFKVIMSMIKIMFYSSYNIQTDDQYDKRESIREGKENTNKSFNQIQEGDQVIPPINSLHPLIEENIKPEKYRDSDKIFRHQLFLSPVVVNKKLRYLSFISFFDLIDNLKVLSDEKNNYYNEEQIAVFSFFNFVIMFFMAFSCNFTTLINIPGREFLNNSFYETFLFFLVKFSSYSSIFWFIIQAATFSYKFMSNIKHELLKTKTSSIPFSFVLKWWCLTLPKIIIFYLIFIIFHVYINRFQYVLNTTTLFQYYLQIIDRDKSCKDYAWKTIIPFWLPYNDSSRHFFECYKFVYYSLNQLYCFIFMTLFIYIAFKIKSKLIDYALFILWVINIALSYLFFLNINGQYLINDVVGQNITEKKTHLAFNYYLTGFWLGISVFYYYDTIPSNSLMSAYQYVPFLYCYSVLRFVDTFKVYIKNIILGVLCVICLLFSLSYTFICLIKRNTTGRLEWLSFDFDTFTNVLDCYEKIIISICFCFIVILVLSLSKDSTIRYLIASHIFIPFSRISTSFFYVVDTSVYIIYCVFLLQLKLSYSNLFYFSIGLLLVISIFSFFLTVMFELPLRILIKFLLKKSFATEKQVLDIKIAAELKNSKLSDNYDN